MHRPVLRRGTTVSGAALALLLLLPAAVSAHGVNGAESKSVPEFVWLGITHMLLGWDHLLFVGGVALIAGTVRRAAGYVSLFALGHSVTLITAAITEWRVSPTKVDLVIGLSVVFVGVVALLARPKTALHWRLFGTAVLGFGLIHGLGLATRLQDIDVHGLGSLGRIVAFNVGVEGGQVIALLVVAFAASYLPARFTSERAQRVASTGIIVLGLLAATLVVLDRANRPAPAAASSGPCTSGERVDTLPVGQGGHTVTRWLRPRRSPRSALTHPAVLPRRRARLRRIRGDEAGAGMVVADNVRSRYTNTPARFRTSRTALHRCR